MRCPVDGEPLIMTERYGIEIDYCPKCRGVWLDRGELDKIIERASGAAPAPASASASAPLAARGGAVYQPEPPRQDHYRPQSDHRRPYRDDDDDDDKYRDGYRKKKRREGFLGDLFDF